MLGKMYEQGQAVLIFNPITKTSNSGLFSNRRLALLSLRHAQIGYLSKVPDDIESFNEANCWDSCKQTVNMRKAQSFLFSLNPLDRSVLILRWLEGKQKQWQFKFDDEIISAKWYQFISQLLYPKQVQLPQSKQAEKTNLDYTKLQNLSRFNHNRDNSLQLASVEQEQLNREPQDQVSNPNLQKIRGIQKSFEVNNRFRQFQKLNATQQVQTTLPIITTFRQKLPSHSRFNNIASPPHGQLNDYSNWNSRWYKIIQNDQLGQQILQLYNQFMHNCKKTCLDIIEELTLLKNQRTLTPKSVTINEEIYTIQAVTYRLLRQRNSDGFLSQDPDEYQQSARQELQNFKFVMRTTRNKHQIRIPMVCIVEYIGFVFFCEADVPNDYQQVDQNSQYLFSTQIASLEGKLKLKLNLSSISLYTNNIGAKNMLSTSSLIIMRGLKQLLPCQRRNIVDTIYWLPKSIFLQSSEVLEIIKNSNYYEDKKENYMDSFLRSQFGGQGCIISPRDLKQKLNKYKIPLAFLDQIIVKSNSLYLKKIMTTQLTADLINRLIRKKINKLLNVWKLQASNLYSQSKPNYKFLVSQIINELLSSHNNLGVWQEIYQCFIRKYPKLVLRKEDLIIGYLLQSISDGTGVQFDYQFFAGLKHRIFIQQDIIPNYAIYECVAIVDGYQKEDIYVNYQQINQRILNQTTQYQQFNEVVRFYQLKNTKPVIQQPKWLQLCRFISYFVPYGQQDDYNHLDIYSCINLQYLNYSIFCVLISAMKWLLLAKKIEEVLQLIHVFIDASWFWISQTNPFMIKLYQVMIEYYQASRQIQKAIYNCDQCLQILCSLYKQQAQLQLLDVNYKLVKLYMLNSRHRQALDKCCIVKNVVKTYNPSSPIMPDLLRQVSKLYLHLGDVDSSIKQCRQTIDYSLLNPFKDQKQEFQIYAILMRALQIKDERNKFKYYVDIIEDKFGGSKNPYILKETLKLTFQQYLQNSSRYHLKKMAFLVYYVQKNMKNQAQFNGSCSAFTIIQQIQIKGSPPKKLRSWLDKTIEITDQLSQFQRQKEQNQKQQQPVYEARQMGHFACQQDFSSYLDQQHII